MANKVNKSVFNKLKKLAMKERMQVVNSSVGESMLAFLTPTQFAELFPKYYEQGLPDVGGFREAISKKSQQKQQDILTGLASGQATNLGEAESRGRSIREGSTGTGGGKYTPYTGGSYSHAQAAALAKSVGATPEEARILGALVKQESTGDRKSTRLNSSH